MTILLVFLRFAWPYILGAVILGGLWYGANHWCNSVCRDARAERDTLVTEKKQAQDRATALALKWAEQVDKTEVAAKQRKESNDATFSALTNRARSVPAGGTLRLSAAAARVFLDSDNAARAATAPEVDQRPTEGAPAIPEADTAVAYDEREVTAWKVDDDAAYVDVFGKWRGCLQFYSQLQAVERTIGERGATNTAPP